MTRHPRRLTVLFRVAAGPRVGCGHLVRALTLARALGVEPLLSVRGTPRAAAAAARLGGRVVRGGSAPSVLEATRPALLVIDDRVARETAAWRRAARRAGIPIASLHDLGLGLGDADLIVDASVRPRTRPGTAACLGPAYAVLRFRRRRRVPRSVEAGPRVLIALGGGPRAALGLSVGRAIRRRHPAADVRLAAGLLAGASASAPGMTRLGPGEFDAALGQADVAVVGGGVTLYEACSLGRPCVAVAVAASQRPTVRGFAERGAALDGGLAVGKPTGRGARRIARAVSRLLSEPALRRRTAARARRLVDGRGASRVAAALMRLARRSRSEGGRR